MKSIDQNKTLNPDTDEPCPACKGTGFHSIAPPNNEIILEISVDITERDHFVVLNGIYMEKYSNYDGLLKLVNEKCLIGYDLHSTYTTKTYVNYILQWRWR